MATTIQPSFAKGELAPALHGRVDIAAYAVGLAMARNVIVRTQGGVSNRAGSLYRAPVKDHSVTPTLLPFQFKSTDKYVLEFGEQYMRVMRNGANVLEATKVITGATQANPVVITSTAHLYANGDEVEIEDVVGMTELNDLRFVVANITANTFELTDQVTGTNIDGTGYTAYSSGGTAARIYEIVTPFAAADMPEVKYVQSADVMTLTHPSYNAQELSRMDHDDWTIANVEFGPDITHPTGQTVTVNTSGAVTERYRVTAIAETFEESLPATNTTTETLASATAADPVVVTSTAHPYVDGDEILITGFNEMVEVNGRRFKAANVAANTFELEGEDGSAYAAETTGGTGARTFVEVTNSATTKDNTIAWTAVADAVRYAIYRRQNGLYGLLGETELLTFDDNNLTPDLDTSPPAARDPFQGTDNDPGAVSYYQQRRVFGNSNNKPDTSWYTQTGNFDNMNTSTPLQADDAITATLNALEVNEIRHFVPTRDLIVFTSGAEWVVNSGGEARFSADTIQQNPASYWGCSHRRPIVVGGTVLYIEENDAQVRNLGFALAVDNYTGGNLSLLAQHLVEDRTITDWAYSHSPESRIYMTVSDGEALTLAYDQEQEVIAWTHWDTAGKYERVVVLRHGESVLEDEVYFVVKRTINGNTVRYIEKQASRVFDDVRDAYFVDAGLTFDNPINITNVTTTDPVVVTTASAHGFSNGDPIDIDGIDWVNDVDEFDNEEEPDQLNEGRFTAANVTANTFEVEDDEGVGVDGSAWNAYVEDGEVRQAFTTFSGYQHLANTAVAVLADGNVIPDIVVSSDGVVTLPRAFSRVHVGLKFIADIETLNIESSAGTIQGKLTKIPKVTIRFDKSRGLWIGPDNKNLVEMKQREFEVMGSPTKLLTGDKEIIIPPAWNVNGRLFLRQRDPLPLTVLAIIPDIFVEDEE